MRAAILSFDQYRNDGAPKDAILYGDFISKYEHILKEYWFNIKGSLINWKSCYEWLAGVKVNDAINIRNKLETIIDQMKIFVSHTSYIIGSYNTSQG